jgi:peptidoglycan hydrolase-like protein with peptidoglycan-binding domain
MYNNNYFGTPILLPEFESLMEVSFSSRNSVDYIKWIQTSLNRLLSLSLTVDGIRGTNTKSAIRSFQKSKGLKTDGDVGPNTEASLISAGASAPPGAPSHSLPPPSLGTTNISALQSNIVKQALSEWARWGNGTKTEGDATMKSIIINNYWKKGINFYNEEKGFDPWSGVFISYVVRQAGAGKAFRYSSSHATYSYYAKKNRLANNPGTLMAYHISEIKPQSGDIIVAERNNSGLSYNTLDGSHMSGHGDIIVEIISSGVYVIGGNVGNSGSGARGVTVNRKRMISLSADGYLTGSGYDIIIRAGGASPSELRTRQSELELEDEFESLFENEMLFETTINRNSKDYIKWVQQSLNQIMGLSLAVDGDKGVKTKSAIRSFQSSRGLKADALVGVNTEAALIKAGATPPLGYSSASTSTPVAVPASVINLLDFLGYDTSKFSVDQCIKDLQKDHGLTASGQIDTKTNSLIQILSVKAQLAQKAIPGIKRLSRFRLTKYYVADESDYPSNPVIPVIDVSNGNAVIANVDPGFFISMSIEGTGKLRDGRLLNVNSKRVTVTSIDAYKQVLERAKKSLPGNIWKAGVVDNGGALSVLSFSLIPASRLGVGYGMARGVAHTPYKTLAADIGAYKTSDSRFKTSGGLVPPQTKVFMLELAGEQLPGGSIHDGWCTVNDTGGAIFGAHFDVFTGSKTIGKKIPLSSIGHIWFQDSETRCPPDYTYGHTK